MYDVSIQVHFQYTHHFRFEVVESNHTHSFLLFVCINCLDQKKSEVWLLANRYSFFCIATGLMVIDLLARILFIDFQDAISD